MNAQSEIDQLLALHTWAIVGLSNNPDRAAYGVAELLQSKGHRIVPVHPKAESVHGKQGFASLSEIPFAVDVVDLFVNSQLAGEVVDQAIAIGATGVWLQLDVIDDDAIMRAKSAGLLTAMNRCPAIEYRSRN
ncbi:MAG: CoA-binding protein [Actinobacteria bacterium]|nr:CoA-binding protein [Actinomycetota bacterium]